MEESQKELLENLKNFDVKKLITGQSYVEIETNGSSRIGFIINIKDNEKCEIYIQNYNHTKLEINNNYLNFYGKNELTEQYKKRESIINFDLCNFDVSDLISHINKKLLRYNIILNSKNNITNSPEKENNSTISTNSSTNLPNNNKNKILDKAGKWVDITGYLTFQFLEGYLLDCFSLVNQNLGHLENNNYKNLYILFLDIVIYLADIVKSNLNKYKAAYYNRKLLIVSQIHAILACFDILILNLTPNYKYDYKSFLDLNKRLSEIVNQVYQIILASKNLNAIPLKCLINFIKLICFKDVKDRIENYNKNEVYEILNEHMKNLDKDELSDLKKDSSMKETCNELVTNLFNNNMETYIDETYYSYLLSCLKCNNLEKKMNALNDITNIINDFKDKKIKVSFKDFIEKNNILDIFFEDSIHDEVIKRSINLFKYFAKYNCLNDNIIEKIIQKQENNEIMKKLLIEIVSELPKEKKDILFNRLSQGIKFDDEKSNNIEYILKLTESCFNSSNINKLNKNKDVEEEEKKNDEDEDIEMSDNSKEKTENNYYGLNMIFDYIIKDFNDKKKFDENNVDKAINYFDYTINKIINKGIFKTDDLFFFIEKLFGNIKTNIKHNSIIQSIKLIEKLIIISENKNHKENLIQNLKKLDNKYNIISLLINDLIRYINKLPKDNFQKENVYEGIYPHYINVEERLNLIFYFFNRDLNNFGLVIQGKKHIEKIYEAFKLKKFKEERKKFFEIITKNISKIDKILLMEFFKDILQNKNEFDLKEIDDKESIELIIQIFKQINYNNGSILFDGKNIRIGEDASIEGTDMLFDLLTQNSNKIVQEKVSQLLCDVCLNHKNYNNEKISDYWKKYFNKINLYLDNICNSNDKIALNGIIKLIEKIYITSGDLKGKRAKKSDYKPGKDPFKLYHFLLINGKKDLQKDLKLKVHNRDRIIDMRYKLGYYFKVPVNNITLIDLNGKSYTLNDDFENFSSIFSDEKYYAEKGYENVKIKEIQFGILEMKDNPKFLIETNDKIYNILIDNLKIGSNDNDIEEENKQKIWSMISKLPKNYFFVNKIKKFGNKEKRTEPEIKEIFDIKEIYIMTYSLRCIYYFLFDKKNKNNEVINKNEYIRNFIDIQQGDKIIINKLLDIEIDSNNCRPIQIECLKIIIYVLNEFEKYKENNKMDIEEQTIFNEYLLNNIFKKLTEIISNLLGFYYDEYDDYDDINDYNINDKDKNICTNEKIAELIKNIFDFIDEITKNKSSYINYIFDNKEYFIKTYINDFINCENDDLKKIIEEYLIKKCEKNTENILKYLKIILNEDIFNNLMQNDTNGKYFQFISLILKKYFYKKENKELDIIIQENNIEKSKKIIDLILEYIKQECDKNENEEEKNERENNEEKDIKKMLKIKENFKEGIIVFLTSILSINPKKLINYIVNKVDICNFFLINCNLRKCVPKPLEMKNSFCCSNQSKGAVYKLLLFILKNIENQKDSDLYMKIVDILDKKHKLGFWKTYNYKNWEIEFKEMQKGKYIGLKNMTSTCYLNSIIQQLFMIEMFRETIIKIENPSKENVLYELQLVFSALKIYEFAYYSPKSLVISNKLNFYEQMDADEFYGTLIDKIENDIKHIYSNKSTSKLKEGQNENKNENYKYKDILNYFFGIKVIDELLFVDCGHKRFNEFCYNNIQLEIKEFTNIYDSLKNYFRTEVMDGDNKINCEQCNIKRTCHKHLLLKSLPNILVISLKRFEFDYDTMLKFKLNKYFAFPHILDMKDYLIENNTETNTEYELTGITIHLGVSDYGHYYDLIKGPDNKWYKFNDTNVTEFKEEDIPKEAFGEKENCDDDSYKEKESGKNNAYILVYKRKVETINKMDKSELALPPYDKYSNIKKDIINTINLKLYKSWIIRNIFSFSYQNFVMGLVKLDLAKIIDPNIDNEHNKLISTIKDEGYLKNIKDIKVDKENNISTKINKNDKIFEFCLRYYFNVIIRITRRTQDKSILENIEKFKEIIIFYIENDSNKAKYILEEFTYPPTIEEFLIYCQNTDDVNDITDIIYKSIEIIYKISKNLSNENSFIFEFLNTWINYIQKNIRNISLDNLNNIFYKIINLNPQKFVDYMKRKNLDKWLYSFIKNENDRFELIFNERNLPTIHTKHTILSEKTKYSDENIDNLKKPQNDEIDFYDQQFYNKVHDLKSNHHLLGELWKALIEN